MSSLRALLLDLDNTLLQNDMEDFIPAYLSALGQHMAGVLPPKLLVQHLLRATDAMIADEDLGCSNMAAFDAVFFPAVGRSREELEPLFDDFYADVFPRLRGLTRPDPAARSLVEWAFGQGFQIVIATNPLFPLTAIEQRLEWAGVPAQEFSYDLITSYENMHAAKPHPSYYREIADQLGRRPEECLMVGDDWKMDIGPALQTGMYGFWIDQSGENPAQAPAAAGRGSLADVAPWIRETLP